MSDCRNYREVLVHGEAAGRPDSPVQEHLQSCAACRAFYAEIQDALASYERYGYEAPPDGYWDGYVERLEGRIARSESDSDGTVGDRRHGRRQFWKVTVRVAAALVLFGLGVVIGRATVDQADPETSVSRTASSPVAEASVSHYLTRAQTLFLGVQRASSLETGTSPSAVERRAADRLLHDGATIQGALDDSNQPVLSSLIDDVQLALMEIANASGPHQTNVGRALEELGLQLRINLYLMSRDPAERRINM